LEIIYIPYKAKYAEFSKKMILLFNNIDKLLFNNKAGLWLYNKNLFSIFMEEDKLLTRYSENEPVSFWVNLYHKDYIIMIFIAVMLFHFLILNYRFYY
jgi:hypothetical protein